MARPRSQCYSPHPVRPFMNHRYLAFTCVLSLVVVAMFALTAQSGGQQSGAAPPSAQAGAAAAARGQGGGRGGRGPITIHAARVLDGKGGMIQDGVVTVTGTKITAIGPRTPAMTAFTY